MDFNFINVGFGSYVSASKVVAIVDAHSAPVKRLIQSAFEQRVVIDATYGRKNRSVIVAESGHIVLSYLQQETISRRAEKK